MVGKINIFFTESFREYLDELAKILYKEDYFGFIEDADFYIDKIYDYIYENIELPISKHTPVNFSKFGSYFMKYKANQQTTWYIFFDEKDGRYLVNYIMNNHRKEFSELL